MLSNETDSNESFASSNNLLNNPAASFTAICLYFVSAGAAFFAILFGEARVYAQLADPTLQGIFWPTGAMVVAGTVVACSVLAIIFVMEYLAKIASPKLFDENKWGLAGVGGLSGAIAATGVSVVVFSSSPPTLADAVPHGTGESAAALALVALPMATICYAIWDGRNDPRYNQACANRPDPETVRKTTSTGGSSNGTVEQYPIESLGATSVNYDSDDDISETNDSSGTTTQTQETVDFDDLEFNWTTETDVSMADVGGMEDLKDELRRDVIGPLTTEKEKAEALGIPLPNLVLHGPPGTGKTYIAKALATEVGLPFVKLSGADVQSKWINESASKVNDLFTEAKAVADSEGGAIVFLDELDAVLKQRQGASSSHEEDNKVVAEFLNHLQETSEHDVVFIGATNRLDALDEAGIRDGRIDKKIRVGKPDCEAREAILRAQLRDRPHELTDKQIRAIAERTDGMVAVNLENLIVDAARRIPSRRDDFRLRWEDVQRVLAERDDATPLQ